MVQRLNNILRAVMRAKARLHDRLFGLACDLLLPISTYCKVCNILRGIALGFLLGTGFACLAIAPFIHRWWGC